MIDTRRETPHASHTSQLTRDTHVAHGSGTRRESWATRLTRHGTVGHTTRAGLRVLAGTRVLKDSVIKRIVCRNPLEPLFTPSPPPTKPLGGLGELGELNTLCVYDSFSRFRQYYSYIFEEVTARTEPETVLDVQSFPTR